MECTFVLPVHKSWNIDVLNIVDNNSKVILRNLTPAEADYIVQAINSHEKLKTYKTERENIFALLNEKQLPIVGGMCLDSIIRNLVKEFERRQAFIEEHDEAEAYREYEVFCNEQDIEQVLKEAEMK